MHVDLAQTRPFGRPYVLNMQGETCASRRSDEDASAYRELSADIFKWAVRVNALFGLLLAVTDMIFSDHPEEFFLWPLLAGFLTLPFLLIAMMPIAIRRYSARPALGRERLKAMNAFTAMIVLLWAPGVAETIYRINNPAAGDGGAWGGAALLVLVLAPLIILCTRLEEGLFTRISVRLFGLNGRNEAKTGPTLAVMLVSNLLQAATARHLSRTAWSGSSARPRRSRETASTSRCHRA